MPQIVPATSNALLRWPGWYPVLGVPAVLSALIFVYLHDPETSAGFLPCPFRWISGLLCPGCGAQRAMHDLLHGRIAEAFMHNAALVLSIPLLGLQWAVPRVIRSQRDPASNNSIVYLWLVLLLGWGIFRNVVEASHHH